MTGMRWLKESRWATFKEAHKRRKRLIKRGERVKVRRRPSGVFDVLMASPRGEPGGPGDD